MTDDTKSKDYEVGYGRPPKASRFKPGHTGNSKGRPKGAKGVAAVLRERLLAKVTVIESGRRRTTTVIDALVAKLIKGAFDGDSRAMDKLMKLLPLLDNDLAQEAMSARAAEEAAETSTAGDRAVLEALAGMLGGTLDGLAFEVSGKPGRKADE